MGFCIVVVFFELSGPCLIRLAVGNGDNRGVESIMVSGLPVYVEVPHPLRFEGRICGA